MGQVAGALITAAEASKLGADKDAQLPHHLLHCMDMKLAGKRSNSREHPTSAPKDIVRSLAWQTNNHSIALPGRLVPARGEKSSSKYSFLWRALTCIVPPLGPSAATLDWGFYR